MTFEQFKKVYEPNLGRHSVNYHSWYTCDAETLDWLKNIYLGSKQFREDFKKKKTVEIVLKDYNTGKEETAKLTYNMGNIEEVIPFNMYPHPWVKMSWDMGYLGLPGFNKLLLDLSKENTMDYTELNNLTFEVLDNDHWPALHRGSFIIIREDVAK